MPNNSIQALGIMINPLIRSALVNAGWRDGRWVEIADCVPSNHPASAILGEFGGLHLQPAASKGVECATSDIRFCSPDIDTPTDAWGRLLRTKLVAVAEVQNAHGLLYVASDGRCFGASCIHDAFYYEGSSIDEALEHLLTGIRAKPMLRPDQHSVILYGSKFVIGDSALYKY